MGLNATTPRSGPEPKSSQTLSRLSPWRPISATLYHTDQYNLTLGELTSTSGHRESARREPEQTHFVSSRGDDEFLLASALSSSIPGEVKDRRAPQFAHAQRKAPPKDEFS